MLHVVQFSGGAASAVVAKMVVDQFGKDHTVLLHHDTKSEDPDTYRFIDDVSNYLDVPITDRSDGRDLWQLINDNKCLPSHFIPFCTRILKTEQGAKYFKGLDADAIDYVQYNGFGPDEWRRIQRATLRCESLGRKVESPLYKSNITDPKSIICDQWGIKLPNAYKHLKHNNCIPCFKAGKKSTWYKYWRHYPEQFWRAVAAEEKIEKFVYQDKSLRELAGIWAKGTPEDLFGEYEPSCECWG